MSNGAFELKGLGSLFNSTTPKGSESNMINVNNLRHYANHPFRLYTGKRLEDMVESIKANGIIMPLIVRPLDGFTYEILAGHNRLEGAKAAGLEEVPCIIKEGLTDEEAELIVTETNLIQRSFADLSHSERAAALSAHYEAVKKQGKRTDLIEEINELLNNTDDIDNCFGRSDEAVGERYGISPKTVARYIRINTLIVPLKKLLDTSELSIRAGVNLSYLKDSEQEELFNYVSAGNFKIDIKKSELIREASEKGIFGSIGDADEFLNDIFLGKKKVTTPKKAKVSVYKLKAKTLSKFFKEDETLEAVEEKIIKALEFYEKHNPNVDTFEGEVNAESHDEEI